MIDCSKVQHFFAQEHAGTIPDEIIKHLKDCPECRDYAAQVINIQQILQKDLIKPDPETYQKLVNTITPRRQSQRSLWDRLLTILDYRIPVYQVVTVVVLIFIMLFAFEDYNLPEGGRIETRFEPIAIEEISLVGYNLLDSLTIIDEQKIGRNTLEDSALTRYLVPIL